MQPRLRPRFALAAVGLLLTSLGCVAVKLQDKSTDAKYRDAIGQEFVLQTEFRVYGTRWDLRAPQPDTYKMYPTDGPGIGGPEISDFGFLPAGTRIRLIAAAEETLSGATDYTVVVVDPAQPQFANRPIHLNNTSTFHLYSRDRYPSGAPKLNPAKLAPAPPL